MTDNHTPADVPAVELPGITVWHGDCIDVMQQLADNSIDAIVTDPPYGLGFMGKAWDDLPPGLPWAVECLRVLKPGGHLLAFGGTRTWHRLACAIEDAGFEIRDSIAWLYGSGFPKSLDVGKAIDKAAGAQRAASGERGATVCQYLDRGEVCPGHDDAGQSMTGATVHRLPTAPATAAARQWNGWGTALKPAHEPVVVGRKPAGQAAMIAAIGSHLDRLESEWRVQAADPTTPTGAADGSPAQTGTSWSESEATTSWNTVTSWRASWVEFSAQTSTSTTSITSEGTTDLRTLLSCLASTTATNMLHPATNPPGLTSNASAVGHLFASAVYVSRATLERSAADPATDCTPPAPQDGDAANPAFEPVVVARKPLTGTVAANVLAHGAGALNIDACRVGYAVNPQGRWPANVALDDTQATALDQQTGQLTSGRMAAGTARATRQGDALGTMPAITAHDTIGDTGGASRFFPTFRYQAKAPTRERPKVDGVAHPTVKPLELMRWLVRLVTPPGGIVLDPFAGSGTTLEAARAEGFTAVGIERETDYLPLIVERLTRDTPTPETVDEVEVDQPAVSRPSIVGEQPGLFDLMPGSDND